MTRMHTTKTIRERKYKRRQSTTKSFMTETMTMTRNVGGISVDYAATHVG